MPAAVCPLCNGTGYKIVEREEVSGAVKCECFDVRRAERFESKSGVPPLYENADFEHFDCQDNRALKDVFHKVRWYVREFPPSKPGLLLTGYSGTGKTHLAVAAFRAIMAKYTVQGLFFDYQNLLDRIRSGYDAVSNSSDKEAYRIAMECDILLLDDLGAHRVTDWAMDTVTSIITARCNQRKPLIATTNLVDPDFDDSTYEKTAEGKTEYRTTLSQRIGERARSRLFEMCNIVKMPPIMDFRVRKKALQQ